MHLPRSVFFCRFQAKMTDLETKLKEAKEEARQQNSSHLPSSRLRFNQLQPCNWEAAANLNVQLTGTEAGMNAMILFPSSVVLGSFL